MNSPWVVEATQNSSGIPTTEPIATSEMASFICYLPSPKIWLAPIICGIDKRSGEAALQMSAPAMPSTDAKEPLLPLGMSLTPLGQPDLDL